MAANKNALKSVVIWLHDVIKVLAQHLNDVESKKEVLLALGLNPAGAGASPAIPAGALASIEQYVDKSDDEIDIEAFLSVVDDIISVSNAVEDFIHLVTDSEDPEIVADFLDMMLQLYLTNALRLRRSSNDAKAFYLVCKTLNLYQELAAPSGGISHFTANIGALIKRAATSFNAENDTEADHAGGTVFLLLAAVSYASAFVREHLEVLYGFDPPPDSTSPVADAISQRAQTLSLSFRVTDLEGNKSRATLILSTAPRPKNHQGAKFEMLLAGSGKFERKFGHWTFSFAMEGVESVDVRSKIKLDHDGEQPALLIGDSQGTHLRIGGASFEVKASVTENDVDFKLSTKNSGFALSKGKSDGFISSILPDKDIVGEFDLGIGYSLSKGLYVDGGSGLTVLIPAHTSIGPLRLNSIYLKLAPNAGKDGVLFETSVGLSTKFLGFSATVERIGLEHKLSLPADGKKNLGFINYGIGFKPPNGVGMSLDAGPLKGGGFLYFDADKGEYFGALELSFKDLLTFKAIGVINTKMPDGSKGFSMLVIITAEFPPFQLGFGFTLNGLGGMLGLNRTARIDVLREGIKTNVLDSILFPKDVVANMSRIISDIRQVFPPQNDRFLIMPMAKLGWGTPSILTLSLGLLLEIPVPRIAILGVLKASLPAEDAPLLRLQVNFLGVIDFENQFISFDASLYDSRLLTFTLSGDMAFRLAWGNEPLFILSVGGFHPAFKEAPRDLQNMTRLTLSLLSGENPRLTIESYFAVTSNTVQFGARAELYAAAAGFNIYGFIGYDLLFQFDPFRFVAGFAAGLALRRNSNVIMGIRVSGELAGPGPWDAKGEASFSILFFDVTIGFHETWGDRPDAVAPATADLTQRLSLEINDNRNWKADIPDNNSLHVSLKKFEAPAGKLVIHPFGVLTFSERLVPLEVTIDKFGNSAPKDARRFAIGPSDSGMRSSGVTEQFAPANFVTLSDSDKLARPSFEQMKSGFRMEGSAALIVPATVSKSVDYEMTYLRKQRGLRLFAGVYKYAKALFKANLKAGAVASATLSATRKRASVNAPDAVRIKGDGYAVASTSDLTLQPGSAIASYSAAAELLAGLEARNPSLRGTLQVVAEHELNELNLP